MRSSFLSVVSRATADNKSISLVFSQVNVPFGVTAQTFTVTVSNIMKSDTEIGIATKVWQAFQAKINELDTNNNPKWAYTGYPVFTMDEFPFTFRSTQTDHILNFWSQSPYSVQMVTNNSGAYVRLSDCPIFPLLSQAKDIARVKGVFISTMSDDQVVDAIEAASALIVSWLGGFNVVMATYLHEETGDWKRGFDLKYNPVPYHDYMVARGPYIPSYVGALATSVVQRFNVDEYLGSVEFLDWSNALQLREIGDFGNVARMTYQAGYNSVPLVLRQETVRVLDSSNQPSTVRRLSGGSGSIELEDYNTVMKQTLYNLQQFAP